MPVGVWTQTLRISWSPSLDYYEGRIQFLKDLEEAGLVRAFKLSDLDRAEAHIGKSGHELVLTPTSVVIDVVGEDGDWEDCDVAVSRAVEVSRPAEFRRVAFSYQLLAPLEMPKDAAISAATSAWFGHWTSSIVVSDHALLVDATDQDGDFQIKAEFGIVGEDEIPDRIMRGAGRTGRRRRKLPANLKESGLPEVAMYMDFHADLSGSVELPADLGDWLGELRKKSRSVAVEWCDILEESLINADKGDRKVQI